ncbi:MAG: DUF2884 family protein, partial [Rhodanobacter sp.]
FDRASPAPTRVELHQGALQVDGVVVRLAAEQQDRLSLFERELRALAPRVRTVARNGVDMAATALRSETASMGLAADTRNELDRRISSRATQFKQRIDASNSTHDWQGDLMNQYASQVVGDLMPLVVADLGQQALNAAMSGDMQAAANLRDRATNLTTELEPRLRQRMEGLRPQIEALCPSIQHLGELQYDVRGADGKPLNLLQVDS